jgi:hypothetical protein
MTPEERQLLLKDLCPRLPYNIIIRCTDSDTDYKCFLTTDILHEIQNGYEYYDYKPYLRPMSSMTEEERKHFESLCCWGKWESGPIITLKAADWLNENKFDYRGLIPGLALEAPEGMYKTE